MNHEVLAKKSYQNLVAVDMAHAKRTQEKQYPDKLHFEDKTKYVGMRAKVSKPRQNIGQIVYGTVYLNMDTNPDIRSEKMPFRTIFDEDHSEEPEFMNSPYPDVEIFEAKDLPPNKSKR